MNKIKVIEWMNEIAKDPTKSQETLKHENQIYNSIHDLADKYVLQNILNEEIEIIEELKEIEELNYKFCLEKASYNESWLVNCIEANQKKINVLIENQNKIIRKIKEMERR